MPSALVAFCLVPRCPHLAHRAGRCRVHALDLEHARRNIDVRRWYRTPRWKALRQRILREQDYQCAECKQITARLEIDHKVKHEGNPLHFWDRGNLWALCRKCHQTKTQRGE